MSWGSQEYMSRLKKGCKFLNQAAQSVTCIPLPTEFNAFMEDIPGYPYGVYVDNFINFILFIISITLHHLAELLFTGNWIITSGGSARFTWISCTVRGAFTG